MSKNYMNDSQASEIVKYISDTMKLPLIGAGGGFAPIGTINFFDASVAPQGWLACNGTTYNIADYPDLATYYASVHGASNFYGGNGTTTFAVPDLRGEFLRGTGTNGHANQGSGANVGVHQDGTIIPDIRSFSSDKPYIQANRRKTDNSDDSRDNEDSTLDRKTIIYVSGTYASSAVSSIGDYTSRPTNTSFLICVKATLSDAEINTFNVYTPREHQVAWWEEEIDGVWKRKPVYQKTYHGTITSMGGVYRCNWDIGTDIEKWMVSSGTIATESTTSGGISAIGGHQGNPSTETSTAYVWFASSSFDVIQANHYGLSVFSKIANSNNKSCFVNLQYTLTTDQWQTS